MLLRGPALRVAAAALAIAALSCRAPRSDGAEALAPTEARGPAAPPPPRAPSAPRGHDRILDLTRQASFDAEQGRGAEALAVLEGLLAEHPNLFTLDALFKVAAALGRKVDVAGLCKAVREKVHHPVALLALFDRCLAEAHTTNPAVGLSWASADDLELYRLDLAARAARDERINERTTEELLDERDAPAPDGGAPRR